MCTRVGVYVCMYVCVGEKKTRLWEMKRKEERRVKVVKAGISASYQSAESGCTRSSVSTGDKKKKSAERVSHRSCLGQPLLFRSSDAVRMKILIVAVANLVFCPDITV